MSEEVSTIKAQTLSVPQDCVTFNLGKAYRTVVRLHEKAFSQCGVTSMQYGLLIHLANHGPIAGKDISALTGHDPSTISRTIGNLMKLGWASYECGRENGRRTKQYCLTEEGWAALDHCLPVWKKTQKKILQSLDPGEWDQMVPQLQNIASIDIP